MKTSALYFVATILTYLACTPINRNIGMRQVYQYPVSKNKELAVPIDLAKTLSVPLQTFTIDPDVDTILYGKEGTIIFIDPRCLVTTDTFLSRGKIKIELKELYTKEALLKERACTISNGSMLESDGSIYIQAFSENGTPLFIGCENAVNIRLPKEIKENMVYFEGNRSADGNMNWNLTETIAPIYEESNSDFIAVENDGYITETEQSLNTYFFSIKNFGWINCDRFYEDIRERKDLAAAFILPEPEKNILETYNYIVFDSLMSVIPLYKEDSGHWVCPGLPSGEAITCVSIQKSGSRLYYGTLKTHVGDWALTVTMHEIKEQELEKLLDLTL